MEIAPGVPINNWIKLKLKPYFSDNWKSGAAIIEKRIRGRYLDPIAILIKSEHGKRIKLFGFTIISIDCLLIEAFQQFKEGKDSTQWRDNASAFKRFFNENKEFHDLIGFEKGFYNDVRCGLLHQAELKKNWKLRASGKTIEKKADGFIHLNRIKFHESIDILFKRYISNLITDDTKFDGLREMAINKMKFICRA
jgi:hypothetical protein